MDVDRIRGLARVSGSAEAAREMVSSAATNATVLLRGESFSGPLRAELDAMAKRLQQIDEDLHLLAFQPDGPDCGTRRHRLANGGREPAPASDVEQLAAIEGRS